MKIAKNKVVSFDYTLTLEDGEVLDSSDGRDPLSYIQGLGNIISGLEAAMEGRESGDVFKISIPPEDAYGIYNDELVQSVPRSMFDSGLEIVPGMEFSNEDNNAIFRVIEIQKEHVVLDGNHPLAGEKLTFDIKITNVREASSEELSHGHVHGPGGHHH